MKTINGKLKHNEITGWSGDLQIKGIPVSVYFDGFIVNPAVDYYELMFLEWDTGTNDPECTLDYDEVAEAIWAELGY